MVCSSSKVLNTRAGPSCSNRPLVAPYTPPFLATSSPNSNEPGSARSSSPSAKLTPCASVIGSVVEGYRERGRQIKLESADSSGHDLGREVSRGRRWHARLVSHARLGGTVELEHALGVEHAGGNERASGAKYRILLRCALELSTGAISRVDVAACVTEQSHARQV